MSIRARMTASRVPSISTRLSISISRRSAVRRAPIPRPIPAPSRRCAIGSLACPNPRPALATGPGRFSFNVKGGRCEACEGDGVLQIEMHFLPDVFVQCDVCNGKRYNRETLEVMFKGARVSADVLDMTVEEGAEFFGAVPVDPRQARDPRTRRPRLYPCRPGGNDALGRRSAAGQARERAVAPRHRPAPPLHSRRADHDGPPFRGCGRSCSTCCMRWSSIRAIRCW